MNHHDALRIAEELRLAIAPGCEEDGAVIVGSVRRHRLDVHDIELLAKPKDGHPPVEFGSRELIFKTHLDKILYNLEREGCLRRLMGAEKLKKYAVRLEKYGLEALNEFKVEFYVMTPPEQWGVGMVIRTGPGSEEDNFSRWCVTNRSAGGALPDGYKVKHLGVWTLDQLDAKLEPLKGEMPLPMPEERDFLEFLGLGWIPPESRHVPRRRG